MHKLNAAHRSTYMYVCSYVSDQVCKNEPFSVIKVTDLFLSYVTYNLFVLIITTNAVECMESRYSILELNIFIKI